MTNADSSGRAGQTGGGGSQPAPGGSPAPEEAKPVAKPFGVPASGMDLPPVYGDRAQDRYHQLNRELKEAKEELARLRDTQNQVPERQPWQQAQSQQPDPYEKSLSEIRKMARQAMDKDPEQALSFIEQMSEIKATKAANQTLQGFFQEMQQREAETRFRTEADSAWQRAVQAFPELVDENTEFYQESKKLFDADPYLKQIPDGAFKAAQIAWSERSRKANKPQQLESGVGGIRQAPKDDLAAQKKHALERARVGDTSAVAEFFTANLDKIIRK